MAKLWSFGKLTWVEMKLFLRDPMAAVFTLALPLIMLVLLSAVFGNTPTDEEVNGLLIFRGAGGADYYMTSSVVLVIAAIGLLAVPIHLAGYREAGILRRFRASSIPAWSMFGAQLAVTIVIAAVGSVIMAVVARLIYSTQFPAEMIGVIVAFVVSTLSFTAIGFLIAALVGTARGAQGITLILFFLFWMLAGTGPPRAVLPDAARRFTDVIPLTHALIAIQDPWFGWGWNWGELGILTAFAACATVPALLLFARNSES